MRKACSTVVGNTALVDSFGKLQDVLSFAVRLILGKK